MSIPGVGPRTTEVVLAYTDDISRFGRGKQYCAYFGLTPKLDESGLTRRLGHISKQGPSVVRWLIVESAWRVIKKSPSLRAFYERAMCGQKKRKKIATVAVARKLLSIMRAMQMTGELFNEKLVCRGCGPPTRNNYPAGL
jgi:transposase